MDKPIEEKLHSLLIEQGNQLLSENSNYTEQKIISYSIELCNFLLDKFGSDLIKKEFAQVEYSLGDFRNTLTHCIEVGAVEFIIKNKLYSEYLKTEKLIKIISSVNFSIAYYIATVFNKKGLRNSEEPCVYNNNALSILVNRSLNIFNDENNLKELERAIFSNNH